MRCRCSCTWKRRNMTKSIGVRLGRVYRLMFSEYGPRGWWPGETPFEVIVGAILAQSTSWSNVEKAMGNLKGRGLLSPKGLCDVKISSLASLIKPSLYYNVKARKLKEFIKFLYERFGGSVERMRRVELYELRAMLLDVWGLGPETVDSIILYALDKPSFVVDAYTKRIFSRLGLLDGGEDYDEVKRLFEDNLDLDVRLFNEYHALIVEHGKRICKKNKPLCSECCLRKDCKSAMSAV